MNKETYERIVARVAKAKKTRAPVSKVVIPSWYAFIRAAQRDALNGRQQFSHEEASAHALLFRGTNTFDEAIELAQQGWQHGSERAIKMAESLSSSITRHVLKTEPSYGVEGVGLDISRHLAGDPECWQQWTAGDRMDVNLDSYADAFSQRLIKLVVNVSPSSEVTPESIDVRGIAVLALVKVLEYAGHRVEINAVLASDGDAGRIEIWVPVKRLTEPINSPRVAFALAHRAMVRRLMFAVMESQPMPDDRCNSGYGKPASIAESDHGDLYLDYLRGSNLDQVEATQGWLLVQLKLQGISVIDDAATEGEQDESTTDTPDPAA